MPRQICDAQGNVVSEEGDDDAYLYEGDDDSIYALCDICGLEVDPQCDCQANEPVVVLHEKQ